MMFKFLSLLSLLFSLQVESHEFVRCDETGRGYKIVTTESNQSLGNGIYSALSDCLRVIEELSNGAVCAAENGGAAPYSIYTGKKLGNGYFSSTDTCIEEVATGSRGILCAPQNGGATLASGFSGEVFGNGYFSTLGQCQEQISFITSYGAFCAAENSGATIFLANGTRIGSGYFASLTDCQAAISTSERDILCGAQSGVIYGFNKNTGRQISGPFSTFTACYDLTR